MKNILLLAYAVSPHKGSEYSVSWNYICNMSKDNRLVVLYGMSGDHMGDTSQLEEYIAANPMANVRFVAVKPGALANFLNSLNRNNLFVYTFYLAYRVWHRQVYRVAAQLVKQESFDIVHYLGPIGYREPGYLWKLNLPYMWGPVGGTTHVPMRLLEGLPVAGMAKMLFRTVANYLQLRLPGRLNRALERANLFMTATTENRDNFLKIKGKDSIYIPENAISDPIEASDSEKFKCKKLKLIWIGTIDERKSLITLLKALTCCRSLSQLELNVVGDGPLRQSLTSFANSTDISSAIIWHGAVSRGKVKELLRESHLNIITSLSEGNPTTIWEAMSVGVPTLTLDHCGMRDTVCESCGVKISVTRLSEIIPAIAAEIDRLACDNLSAAEILSRGVSECAQNYTWESRRLFFNRMYDIAIDNFNKKRI